MWVVLSPQVEVNGSQWYGKCTYLDWPRKQPGVHQAQHVPRPCGEQVSPGLPFASRFIPKNGSPLISALWRCRHAGVWADHPHASPLRHVLLEWLGPNHFGSERLEMAEAGARRVLAGTLCAEPLASEGLKLLSANHRIRVALAQRLRREMTMDPEWVAEEPGVGGWKCPSNRPKRKPRPSSRGKLDL